MAETMKFGPQWLRNLSDGSANNSATSSSSAAPSFVPGNYKLAEHRYGREEMLALYVPNSKIPECMKQFPAILHEKALSPMAFIAPTEEEQRLMSQSVNSTAVLRMMGRGSGPSQRGGRGGGDRGRGRGRGRGEGGFSGFHRQTSLEDDGYLRGRHGRGDGWEEGEKGRFDRGASGFGGRASVFDEGPTSPRKEFSRSMSTDNWRELRNKSKEEEEDDGGDWRRAGPRDKWTSRSNWRDHRDREYERRYEDYNDTGYRERSYNRTKSGSWEDPENDLPEWSTAEVDDLDNLGTFDSSGLFMSLKEAKEMAEHEDRHDRSDLKKSDKEASGSESGENDASANHDKEKMDASEEEVPPDHLRGSPKSAEEHREERKEGKHMHPSSDSNHHHDNHQDRNGTPPSHINARTEEQILEQNRLDKPPHIVSKEVAQAAAAAAAAQLANIEANHNLQIQDMSNNTNNMSRDSRNLAELVARQQRQQQQQQQQRQQQQQLAQTMNGPPQADDDFGHLEKAAEDLVATWTAEEDAKSDSKAKVESGGVPLDHEDAKKWFYRDPQGDLQGPFKAAEMAEWFSAGYFTMNLLVKRGCDSTFQPLGELIKRWGRVPFLPGPAMPPLKEGGGIGVSPVPAQPQVDVQQEQLKMLQQQMFMQQQLFLQQVQMNQMMATLQQQESFAKLSPQQQQQLALQLMLKHHVLQQGQAPTPGQQAPQPQPSQQSPPQPQPPQQAQPPQQQPPPSLSPRSEAQQVSFQRQMSQPIASQAGPLGSSGDAGIASYHRTLSQQPPQPHMEDNPLWAGANPTPTSAGWTAPTSVWDIEPPKTQSLEEIQRLERLKIDQQQRDEAERRENERRRQEEEMRKRQEDEERRRQEEEIRRRQEEERRKQMEMELERQRLEQLERIRLQREAEENARRQEEERRRREEEERRRREEEERRQREAEERRRQLEEQRRKEQEELERKRQEEIRRRQEKAEEIRRQQQETIRRLQEEQMANMQLPQSAQWASNNRNSPSNSAPSLAEIQELESQRAAKEAEEKQRRIEQQRQQLAAIQQQQQQQNKTWAQQRQVLNNAPTPPSNTPSLLEIQQEQAMQLERDKQRQQQQQQQKQTQNLPLRTAAVWSGASNASHWAAEGAWGNLQNRQSAGFWDEAVGGASNKKPTAVSSNNNSTNSFPSLTTSVAPQQAVASNKNKSSKAKRDEESVQRLFQQMKPKDEFTQWCENALRGMQSSVDVPTFVAFLMDVESPYEVHDYVRSYLGEGKDAIEFGKQFLERRSKYKNHLKQEQPEEIWGPAQAVNPNLKNEERSTTTSSSKNNKKKKQKMQKVDSSILGFTVHAETERLNMGEIETTETATFG